MESIAEKFRLIHVKARPIISICLYGLVASLAAVGFQLLINWFYNLCYKSQVASGFWHFAATTLAVMVVTSLIVGWLLNSFCPEAAGSGIPQAKLAFWKEFGFAPRRIAWIKFLAGVLSIGGGQSLGREGPSVQIGSNLAASVAGLLGVPKQNRRSASAAGSSAGLAAAFNAPLASVAFVLEEIIGDLNSRSLGAVLVAAVIGAFVVHAFIGAQPAFEVPHIKEPTWRAYLLMPFAAGLAAFVGGYFQRASMLLRAKARGFHRIPKWLHPLVGGLATWCIGISIFAYSGRLGVFGLGYDDLSDALMNGMAWKLAALLLIGKLAATVICYGLGGCGGIFSPNLFFGAMCGAMVAGVGSNFMSLDQSDQLLLAVGGMSACLGAVVQAPVTAILIIFEMTHQFALIPGLMLAGLVSQVIAHQLNRMNFYEEVLHQDGHQMEHLIPPRDLRSWQGLPISAIANYNPVLIEDLNGASLNELLAKHPYRYFPVVKNGSLQGIAARNEIEWAIIEGRPVKLEPAQICLPSETIRESQSRFIESTTGTVILTDKTNGVVMAIITMHDILRAQLAMSDREGEV